MRTVLTVLTREGCARTDPLRANLDDAIRKLGREPAYDIIDADTLQDSDARRGYGTPTILFGALDLFGLPAPSVPCPAPT